MALIEALARAVARELSAGDTETWVATCQADPERARIQRGMSTFAVRLYREWGSKGRFTVCADLPSKGPTGSSLSVLRYNEKLAEITVADTRTPTAIANEIRRRLLPTALVQHDQAVAIVRNAWEYAETTDRVARKLAKFGHTGSNPDAIHVTDGPTVHVQGNSVRFETFYVPADLAEKLLTVLAAETRKAS